MFNIIKKSFFPKDQNIVFLFLGMVFLEFTPVVLSILLLITKKPISGFIEAFISIVLFMAMLLFVYFHIRRKEASPDSKSNSLNALEGILSGFTVYIFIAVVMFAMYGVLKAGYSMAGNILADKSPVYYIVIVALIAAAVIAGYLIYAGILLLTGSLRYGITPAKQLNAFVYLVGVAFKNIVHSTVSLIIALAMSGLALFLLPHFFGFLQLAFPSAFLRLFIQALATAAIESYLVCFLINTADELLVKYRRGLERYSFTSSPPASDPVNPEEAQDTGKRGAFGIPLLTILLLGALVFLWIFNFSQKSGAFDDIERMIAANEIQGEAAFNMQMTDISAVKFKKAYSMTLAAEAYIQGLIYQNPTSTNADKEKVKGYPGNFDAAFEYDRTNVWIYVFRGYLENNSKNYSGGAGQFKYALQGVEALPDLYFGALESYRQANDKQNAAKMADILVERQMYRGTLADTASYSLKSLKGYLEKFEGIRERIFENLALGAMEKMKTNDFQGMFNDIGKMLQAEPDNKSLLYLYGIAAMSYRPEGANYPAANSAYDRLLELSGGDEDASILKGYMSLLTKDNENARLILKKLYDKHPEYIGIGEQYAYSLLLTENNEEAAALADELFKKDPDSWFSLYIKSLAELNLKLYDKSLEDVAKALDIARKLGLNSYYDQYLYAYSLAYSLNTKQPECMDALNKLDQEGVLFNYITGATAWRDKDHDRAEAFFQKTLQLEHNLGYAEYLLGNVYYERSVTKKTNEFEKAEEHFLSSLSKNPEHTTGWFALGHNYKKWGGHEEKALRAFRKVVDLEPYSDHTTDYYGMTVHAQGEINSLLQYDNLGVK